MRKRENEKDRGDYSEKSPKEKMVGKGQAL